MEKRIFSEKEVEKINKYRTRFKFREEEYSDEEVFKFIEEIRWLARLYINEYKNLSPKEILTKLKLSYNFTADKSTMNRSEANAN